LESTLEDHGLDVQRTDERLAGFMAVQNTYLSTFQSLGGLGLLLGTLGLAVVQVRNVLERRGELALLRAVGFSRARLAGVVLWENAALLTGGLAAGGAAALVAVAPHLGRRAILPWTDLALSLALVLAVGMLAGLAAVRAGLRTELLTALRAG
jgi:ABC-type antimicrobial peptide transport system permease subunit